MRCVRHKSPVGRVRVGTVWRSNAHFYEMIVQSGFVGFGVGRIDAALHQCLQITAFKTRVARATDPEKIVILIRILSLTRSVGYQAVAICCLNPEIGTRNCLGIIGGVEM